MKGFVATFAQSYLFHKNKLGHPIATANKTMCSLTIFHLSISLSDVSAESPQHDDSKDSCCNSSIHHQASYEEKVLHTSNHSYRLSIMT